MKQEQMIVRAFTQGADYGFEKGFESTTEYLRSVIALVPDMAAKEIVKRLIDGLERNYNASNTVFMQGLEIATVTLDALGDANNRMH